MRRVCGAAAARGLAVVQGRAACRAPMVKTDMAHCGGLGLTGSINLDSPYDTRPQTRPDCMLQGPRAVKMHLAPPGRSVCMMSMPNAGHQAAPRSEAAAPLSAIAERLQSGQQASTSGSSFIRPHLRDMDPYTPIQPFEVLSQQLGRRPEDIVKLDANENPYGPPAEVLQALGSMQFPNIYPDPQSRRLREALSQLTGVPIEHLLVGCGADELIDLLMRCILDPGDSIVDCPPTFTMYAFDAAVNDAQVITVPRREHFQVDVAGITAAVKQHRPKAVFLTSPNNPDGSLIAEADLLAVLQLPVLVVLDEAYIEFAEEPSRMDWVQRHDNLVVLRTFSKSAALAGIRVGYGAFPLSIVEYLWRAKQPYNVSAASEVAACAALTNMPYLKPYPSNANFILCKVQAGQDAKAIRDGLAKQGVMVRHYAKKELSGYIRISVGKPEQTEVLMQALQQL